MASKLLVLLHLESTVMADTGLWFGELISVSNNPSSVFINSILGLKTLLLLVL